MEYLSETLKALDEELFWMELLGLKETVEYRNLALDWNSVLVLNNLTDAVETEPD